MSDVLMYMPIFSACAIANVRRKETDENMDVDLMGKSVNK